MFGKVWGNPQPYNPSFLRALLPPFPPSSKMASTIGSASLMTSFTWPSLGITTCEHCGVKCTHNELHCNCADMVYRYGARGCAECGVYYELYKTVTQFMRDLEREGYSNSDAIETTHVVYYSEWSALMAEPCPHCAPGYVYDYECLRDDYNHWLSKVCGPYMNDLYRDDYDDPRDYAPWGGIW